MYCWSYIKNLDPKCDLNRAQSVGSGVSDKRWTFG